MRCLCIFLILAILLSLSGWAAIAQDFKDAERVSSEVDTSSEEQLRTIPERGEMSEASC